MWKFLKRFKEQYLHVISSDEKKIFHLISERLPIPLGDVFRLHVEAIIRGVNQSDGKTIVYELDQRKIDGCRLDHRSGMQEFVEIRIVLNEVQQPFVCFVKDGCLHSLKILQPHYLARPAPEFEVLSFEFRGL